MAFLNIGGVDMPTPSEFQVGIMDISKAERAANGNIIIERIATKRKLEIKYNFLDRDQLQTLLNALSPTLFTVYYVDPQTDGMVVSTFYCGDRNMAMMDYINDVPRYVDFAFNLIER
jgi:hypothetical protein